MEVTEQLHNFVDRGQRATDAAAYEIFAYWVREAGLVPIRCSDLHWQIRHEKDTEVPHPIVNYYPTTSTFFLDRRKGPGSYSVAMDGGLEAAIAVARKHCK